MSTFLAELYAVGTLTDDHDTKYTPTHAEMLGVRGRVSVSYTHLTLPTKA